MKKEQEHRLVNLLFLADKNLKRTIEKRAEGTGVYRSQHRLLMILGRNPDISQTMLAEKLEISPAAVTVSLKKLEKSGYIARQCSEEDNRINRVVITQKGQDVIAQSINYFREMDLAFFEGFSEEEKDRLENMLERIATNSEKYYQML